MRIPKRINNLSFDNMRKIIARFRGYCMTCNERVVPGEQIYWRPLHVECLDCHNARNPSILITKNNSMFRKKIQKKSTGFDEDRDFYYPHTTRNARKKFLDSRKYFGLRDKESSLIDYERRYSGFKNFDHFRYQSDHE